MNIDLKRRFAQNFSFLASYTWSHSIDDSSDLQTLLLPQDNRNFGAERADSIFDQRHRFVFSGVIASPSSWASDGGFHRALSNFTIAPIFEISSGRPFNILSNQDTTHDQSNQTDRPSVLSDGTLCVPGTAGCVPLIPSACLRAEASTQHVCDASFHALALRVGSWCPWRALMLEVIAEVHLFNRFNGRRLPFIDDVRTFICAQATPLLHAHPPPSTRAPSLG